MQEDLISVIVPVYKVEKYLRKCVDSIRHQTYQNIEIILVDDGSPDQCGTLCDEFQQDDPRIKVIHKQNGGLSDARNAGMAIASGQYVGFVDSDDYIAPDMYDYLHELIVKNHADISVCSAVVVSENESANFTDDSSMNVLKGDQILLGMIYQNLFTVNAWNKLYKRQLFADIEFPKGKLYEDLGTTYKLMDRADTVVYSRARKYAYVQRDGSIMNRTGYKMTPDKIEIISQMWEYCSGRNGKILNELQAGMIKYTINDIFKMMGSHNLEKNPTYRVQLKSFAKGKRMRIYLNRYLSLYNRFVLAAYLSSPGLLAAIYNAKSQRGKRR